MRSIRLDSDDPRALEALLRDKPGVTATTYVNIQRYDVASGMMWTLTSTLLDYVIRNELLACLNWMLSNTALLPDMRGITLHSAVDLHWLEGAAALLAHGVDINAVNEDGYTALEWKCENYSVYKNRMPMIRFLIWHGARPGRGQGAKVNALFKCRDRCRASVLAMLAVRRYAGNDVHVIRLVARMLWAMRLSEEWSEK